MRYIDTSSSEILMRNAADTGSISLRKTTGEVIAPVGSASGASYSFGTDFNTGMFSPFTNFISFTTAGVERIRISNTGRLGVGRTVSQLYYKLDVLDSYDDEYPTVRISNENTGTSAATRFNLISHGNDFDIINYGDATTKANRTEFRSTASGSHFVFSPSDSEAMRIDQFGRVGVGTTTPYNNCVLTITQPTVGQSDRLLAIESPVSTASFAIQFVNPNGRVGTIITSGTSTSYNTSSDYRLKENIKPIENILERFKKLKPCSFNFLTDKKMIVDGFLAHEVQEVIPEAVTGVKDEMDEDGTPKYQGIDQAKLVPLLVASVQEILKRLEALEK
jgi:hypothetical protein